MSVISQNTEITFVLNTPHTCSSSHEGSAQHGSLFPATNGLMLNQTAICRFCGIFLRIGIGTLNRRDSMGKKTIKIIKIDECYQCPHCFEMDKGDSKYLVCDETEKVIPTGFKIAPGCPLEDYTPKECKK